MIKLYKCITLKQFKTKTKNISIIILTGTQFLYIYTGWLEYIIILIKLLYKCIRKQI